MVFDNFQLINGIYDEKINTLSKKSNTYFNIDKGYISKGDEENKIN